MLEAGGTEYLARLSLEERLRLQSPLERKYADEFDENGLENLVIARAKG